jgi:hypothetical protein
MHHLPVRVPAGFPEVAPLTPVCVAEPKRKPGGNFLLGLS